MIFSDTEMRELGSGTTYNTHNTTSLIRTLKYVSDVLQTEEASTVEEYKHTHTHTTSPTHCLRCFLYADNKIWFFTDIIYR